MLSTELTENTVFRISPPFLSSRSVFKRPSVRVYPHLSRFFILLLVLLSVKNTVFASMGPDEGSDSSEHCCALVRADPPSYPRDARRGIKGLYNPPSLS